MTSQSFAYWLQGFIELADPKTLTEEQVNIVKAHLNLVFKHEIDPAMGDEKHQAELNKIHQQIVKPVQNFQPFTGRNEAGEILRC